MKPTILKASMIASLIAASVAASTSAADYLARTNGNPAATQTLPFDFFPHLA